MPYAYYVCILSRVLYELVVVLLEYVVLYKCVYIMHIYYELV